VKVESTKTKRMKMAFSPLNNNNNIIKYQKILNFEEFESSWLSW